MCVRYQDGGRLYDLNVDCCDLYRHRSTVDCFYRVLVGVGAADRQLLHRLELRGIARLGLPDQRIYLDGQSTQTLEAGRRNAPGPWFKIRRNIRTRATSSNVRDGSWLCKNASLRGPDRIDISPDRDWGHASR